jgi:hypothetical protein
MIAVFKFGRDHGAGKKPSGERIAPLALTRCCAALLCFVLVAMALVEPFHVHRDELGKEARHCAVCHIAHAPGQPVSSARISVSFTAAPSLITTPDSEHHQDPDSFPLFSRPPPLV